MPGVPFFIITKELLMAISVIDALYFDFFDCLIWFCLVDFAVVMEAEICFFGPTGVID